MKSISSAIDRFCLKHRKFGIPRLMLFIVLISGAVALIDQMDTFRGSANSFLRLLAFSPPLIMGGQVWRLVTWVFTPLNSQIFFIAITLYFYFFIGSTLEREWGPAKFTVYYLFGVFLNIVYGFATWLLLSSATGLNFTYVPLNPAYLNLSMFFAFAVLFPNQIIRLFFFIPVKIKWLALLNAALFAFSIVSGLFRGNYVEAVLPVVALLNFILVCGYDLILSVRPHRSRLSRQTIDFKKAARQARKQYDGRPYRHKCAVCGKTDSESPELEFRYCSRCNGYHCFCLEHINNHVHFQ